MMEEASRVSIKIMSAVWQHSRAKSGDLLVLLAIADFANDDGSAFPAIGTLARKARLSARQVNRSLVRLRELHEVTILNNQGPHGVNLYRVLPGDKLSGVTFCQVTSTTPGGDVGVRGGDDVGVIQSVKENRHLNRQTKSGRARRLEELEQFTITEELHDWAMKEFGVIIPEDALVEFKSYWRDQTKLRTNWALTFKIRIRQLVGHKMLTPKPLDPRGTERKCKSANGVPCDEAPITGSNYCQRHKSFYAGIRARMADGQGKAITR